MCVKIQVFVFSCLFVSKVKNDGYSYPQPPFQFDEIPTSPPTPIYLPPPTLEDPQYLPPVYPPIGTPPDDEILPPLDDGVVIAAPPNHQYLPPPSNQYLPPPITKNSVQIVNMSCLNSRDGPGFFRASFRSVRGFPVMESAGNGCVVDAMGVDGFRIDLEGQRMNECGIRSCGLRMCLVLRMATIPGLRLSDDALVTLQCIPQETVVSHTKHLRLGAQAEQGRANTRSISVASGGNQRKFESTISLFRKNNGLFDKPLQQGSSVRLGDELLLRTSVRDGDGWKSGRLSSVVVRSAASQRSVVLVDENGCRNPSLRSICPQHPQQSTPLTVQFPFRAFLFQGAAPADDFLLSVRMSACLRSRDCQQSTSCEENAKIRSTRSANFSENLITDWESEFQFRVLPRETPEFQKKETTWPVFLLGMATIIVLGFCVLCLMAKPLRDRIYL